MNHYECACPTPGCGHIVCLPPQLEERLRRTHETFFCPAGHKMWFHGKSDLEKSRDSWRRQAQDAWNRIRGLHQLLDSAREGSRHCPLECGYRVARVWTQEAIRERMAGHLVDVHGAAVIDAPHVADAA